MPNKILNKKRMMLYFINATEELIDEMGMENLTLRNIADRAGFNSATIYNYFENLEHLIFFAAMGYIKEYVNALNAYLVDSKNAMDKFLKIWECFCDYSFDKPEIYNAIFFPNLNKNIDYYIDDYYQLFPLELSLEDQAISSMLRKRDIIKRAEITVVDCVTEGFIKEEDANKLNDMTLLIYEGILNRILKGLISYDDARNSTMDYFKSVVKSLLIKDYEFYY